MAIILTDGFDMYNGIVANTGAQARWILGAPASCSMITGRFGGQALQLTCNSSVSQFSQLPFPGSYGSFSFGCAFRQTTAVAGTVNPYGGAWQFRTVGGACQFYARLLGSGAIEVYRSTGATTGVVIGTTAAGVIILNTWQYVEFVATISATVGVVEIWVDGVRVLNLTGVNNAQTPGTPTVGVFGSGNNFNSEQGIYGLDDVYVNNTAVRIGEGKIETLRPSADTATKNWTPNSGTVNFSRVNETLVDGDTSYVYSNTVGQQDLYDLADLSTTPTTIFAVSVVAFAEKTDAGSRSILLTLKSGATASDGSNYNLASSYGRFDRLLEQDPNTTAAWTGAAVNALQVGPKVG